METIDKIAVRPLAIKWLFSPPNRSPNCLIAKPPRTRRIPLGCIIKNIERGKDEREQFVYAQLVTADGELIISATLDYITDQIRQSDIAS